jgi:hypothetical protein
MIEHLCEHSITDRFGNCYGTKVPTNYELMMKINELIDEINILKGECNNEQKENHEGTC